MRALATRSQVINQYNGLGNQLWDIAGARPSLDLRFAENKSLVDATTGQNLVTFTRASEATFVNSQGQVQTAAIDAPRFDHNPTTGESLGLLVEEQRQNLLLNSGTLSTQNVTVTAVAHTLSFTGTGTITLSGTSTAGPLVGTGTGEANRVSLTFTPTAGTLTLTVSGTVTNAQLEIGAFRTSYIPTAGTAATRSADVASISGSNFSSWYQQDEGSWYCSANSLVFDSNERGLFGIDTGSFARGYHASAQAPTRIRTRRRDATTTFASDATNSAGTSARVALVATSTEHVTTYNGGAVLTNSVPLTLDPITNLRIGYQNITGAASNLYLCGCISHITYWPQRLGNEVLQRITQ